MKGAPECMRISGFMHGVNNPELTKRLNEHVPKTMEEMMITTTAFIRGEAAAASKKKGHVSWKPQDQSKRHSSDKRSDFRGHSREGRGSNRFTPLTRTPKEILATEASKFQPPPPMVTPVEKRSSNKFCDFHNDKGHSTDECMQLKKQIEELRTVKQRVTQSFERVKEIAFPPLAASSGTEGPLVIEVEMGGHMIYHMYIDGGSSMEILYEHCFNRLRPEIKGDATHSTKAWMNFMVVKSLSPYNGIIERPGLKAIQAVPSTVHGMLKFPTEGGIVTICSTILIPTECASVITSPVISREEKTSPTNFKVALHPDFPDQEVVIGGTLSDKGRTKLCSVLKKNLDIFAWQPSDMTGVPRSVAEHRLNTREGYSPVRQKKMGQAPERAKAIQAEVLKLCFLDAYKGHHQIQLAEADEEKTAFHTEHGVYCYTKMPFGLKNAGATYQRLMDKAFEGQIGRNIKVYVDDLVVKSYTEAEMIRDIEETFRTLRKVNMKLNPKKCSFGLAEGVFLGYVITPEGIKPCPDKTTAVLQLPSPRTVKEVKSLNGKLASLNRPRTSVKGQTLADFLIEMPGDASQTVPVEETQEEPWTLFTDGSSCVDGSGARLILTSPEGVEFTYTLRFQFTASNNEAEYKALVAGLRIVARMGVKNIQVSVDSNLVANQVLGTYVAKEDNIIKYLEIVKGLIEAKAVATITGAQFSDNPFKDWCDKLNITQRFASVKHPQSNGLVERANRSLGEGIKSRLGEGNKNWTEELPHVLWAHRTMIKSSHGDTPFSLTYGTEAVIPTEIGMPTYRTAAVDVVNNDEELRLNLDLLEECRERAAICEAKVKSKMMKYYNATVRGVVFKPGDFVYRSNDASHAIAGGKLGPKWEGSYEVTEALGNGEYKLRSTDGTILPRTWNAQLSLESIEAYDPEAEAKYVAALQALKDLKYPLVDQLEGLKGALMDVIMAALVLYAPWESLLIPNVLGIALRTQSPRSLGLQPVYAADHVQRDMA
nr:hypothetical protein [Tanacetum cinerariifolium]